MVSKLRRESTFVWTRQWQVWLFVFRYHSLTYSCTTVRTHTYLDLCGIIGWSSSRYVFSRPRPRKTPRITSINLRPLAPSTTALNSVHACDEYRNSVPILTHFTQKVKSTGVKMVTDSNAAITDNRTDNSTAIELNYTSVSMPFCTLHGYVCKYHSVSINRQRLHNMYDTTWTSFTQNSMCHMFTHTAENLQPLQDETRKQTITYKFSKQ